MPLIRQCGEECTVTVLYSWGKGWAAVDYSIGSSLFCSHLMSASSLLLAASNRAVNPKRQCQNNLDVRFVCEREREKAETGSRLSFYTHQRQKRVCVLPATTRQDRRRVIVFVRACSNTTSLSSIGSTQSLHYLHQLHQYENCEQCCQFGPLPLLYMDLTCYLWFCVCFFILFYPCSTV